MACFQNKDVCKEVAETCIFVVTLPFGDAKHRMIFMQMIYLLKFTQVTITIVFNVFYVFFYQHNSQSEE